MMTANVPWRIAILIAVTLPLTVTSATAQPYYYQPAPSYYRNDTREGTLVGGGLGAITGALIGGEKNWEGGALIGAGIGALTGRALGSQQDQADYYQTAVGQSMAHQANVQATQRAITNYDLVQMAQAGLSDELIVGALRSRGGRLDLSPAALIELKRAGVSDRVLYAAQSMAPVGPTPINPAPPVYHIERRPVVVVQPGCRHHYHAPPPSSFHFHYSRHH